MNFLQHFVHAHPVIAAFTALLLLSNLVDAMKRVAPKPTDKGLYAFIWVFLDGCAGNAITALHLLLKVFFPQNEKVLEEFAPGNSASADSSSGTVAHDSDHRQQ